MRDHSLLLFIPLLAALLWAAIGDIRSRRIRNELTFSLLLCGLLQSFFAFHTVSPWYSLAGFGVGFGLTFVLFVMGAIGGGDVKLLAAIGAWVGPVAIFLIFAAEAVIGLFIVLFQSYRQKRLALLFRNSAVLAINVVHAQEVGLDHISDTGKESRSIDRPLPYAVPVLAATVLVLFWIYRMGS
jgi:prepilin peptidase CpaA